MLGKGIAFLVGMTCLWFIPNPMTAAWSALLATLLLLLEVFIVKKYYSLRFFLVATIWANLNILLWFNYSSETVTQPHKAQITGHICSIPVYRNKSHEFDFCLKTINQNELSLFQLNRLKFKWSQYIPAPSRTLKGGQFLSIQAKIRPPHGRYNESGMDYQKWMLAEGYAGTGQVKKAEFINQSNLSSHFHEIRQTIYDKLNLLLGDKEFKGMLFALLMGERSAITDQQWQVLRQSGTSHLLAISGLHVGVAALWCYWFVLFCWRLSEKLCLWLPAQTAANFGALLGGLSILLLSGMGLPAQRAFLMLCLFIVTRLRGQYYSLLSIIGMSLIVLLVLQPFAVLSASFWLSFVAVYVIACVLQKQMISLSGIRGWIQVNVYLFIIMLPLAGFFFSMLSFTGIFANLILVPLTSFILIPILYAAMLFMAFSESIAVILFDFASIIFRFGYFIQDYAASANISLSQSLSETTQIRADSLLIMFVFVGLLLLPNKSYFKGIYISLICLFVIFSSAYKTPKSFEMVVFDIGQGLAVYISTPEETILYDTGWGNNEFALAESTILPFLKSRGITSIDKLIISHGDSDHAGGLQKIIDQIEVKQFLLGEPLSNNQIRNLSQINQDRLLLADNCHSFADWQSGDLKLRFLGQLIQQNSFDDSFNQIIEQTSKRFGNNASCVLSIEHPQYRLLLTGDIERRVERQLITDQLKAYDILVAPHHGSKTSSTKPFVSAISPKHVIFSTGYNNQWGFPKSEVVDRYRAQSSKVWVTHESGAIHIQKVNSKSPLEIMDYKSIRPHFWHTRRTD